MRAELARREPVRAAHWEKLGLYAKVQERRKDGPVFVLHDGPPFTNGDVHIGTALNKVLKDVINRYKAMRGFRTPYVPGWDCHGLPIEQKVVRELHDNKVKASAAELRARCDDFSESWIAKQTAQFKRLGVLADWASEYKTKAPAYEADILRAFASFVDKGLVYRSKKPVYWSIPFETALAEAEVEYKEHVSPSIWVKFPVPEEEGRKFGLPGGRPLSVVIWTTTPWTIPANLAIAVHPEVGYSVVRHGADHFLVAGERLNDLALQAGWIPSGGVQAGAAGSGVEAVLSVKGRSLEGLRARHPFIDRFSAVVLADYVTTESGTGCVHTAPGHGAEDYQTGLNYKLPIYCPVGADGRYLDDGQIPKDLVGLSALESVDDLAKKRTSPANAAVLEKLRAAGALLAHKSYAHSYPHCWRSKTPIIFRAVDQWFVSLDRAGTRGAALAEIGRIAAESGWIPPWGEARIRSAVESRPDWCVSRQRSWGVPIPAFYDDKKNAYLDAGVIRAVADLVQKRGSNRWYEASATELLSGAPLPAGWPDPSALSCGRDTLDVWIDSGSSHAAVLKRAQGGTRWPADLYLEGSDQHRGWFQSSLWTSVVAFGAAPYRNVLTHGFIVDEDRKKISKSSTYEKPQTSDAYVAAHGADVIRLWIVSQDFRDDIPISKEILSHVGETYRLVRNTFRYQLANLHDFDPGRDSVPASRMHVLDRWALHRASDLVRACTAAYEAYEFHRVYQLCNQFCSVVLSAVYHDILKDRLYTLAAGDPLRRSSQTAIHRLHETLVKLLAPILVFTTDEAWSYGVGGAELSEASVHLQDWPQPPAEWTDPAAEADLSALLQLREKVNAALEARRAAGQLGKSLEAAVVLEVPSGDPLGPVLDRHGSFLPELFIVSHVTVSTSPGTGAAAVGVRHAREMGLHRCPRCWRWVPSLEPGPGREPVCSRCVTALNS